MQRCFGRPRTTGNYQLGTCNVNSVDILFPFNFRTTSCAAAVDIHVGGEPGMKES